MGVQQQSTWPFTWRNVQRSSTQWAVRLKTLQTWGDFNCPGIGIDCHKIRVEKCVKISSKKQSAVEMMFASLGKGIDVSGLQNLWRLFTREGAYLAVFFHHLETKFSLSTAPSHSCLDVTAENDCDFLFSDIYNQVNITTRNSFKKWHQ